MWQYQMFSEHADKKEERCPPGQKAATLDWSSAAKCREIQKKKKDASQYIVLLTAGGERSYLSLDIFWLPLWGKKKNF